MCAGIPASPLNVKMLNSWQLKKEGESSDVGWSRPVVRCCGAKRPSVDAYAVAKPLEYPSVKSPLIELASSGKHYGVKVDKVSLRQPISWIDCNGPYYGLEEVRQRFPNAPVSVRP